MASILVEGDNPADDFLLAQAVVRMVKQRRPDHLDFSVVIALAIAAHAREEGLIETSDDLELFYSCWREVMPAAVVAVKEFYKEPTEHDELEGDPRAL